MTDKELLKQAYDALDKITDMFEAVNGRCVIGGDDVYYSAVKVMVKLDERLKQEQGAIAWWRYNAQGEPVLVGGSGQAYEDPVLLFTSDPLPKIKEKNSSPQSEPQKPCQPIVHWRSLQFNGGRPISQPYTLAVEAKIKENT